MKQKISFVIAIVLIIVSTRLVRAAQDEFADIKTQITKQHDESVKRLHDWIGQLLNALDDAVKTNEEMASAYKLQTDEVESTVKEAEKIPTVAGRKIYLTCCWIEVLCTAEVRIMGWIYQELYGKPFAP